MLSNIYSWNRILHNVRVSLQKQTRMRRNSSLCCVHPNHLIHRSPQHLWHHQNKIFNTFRMVWTNLFGTFHLYASRVAGGWSSWSSRAAAGVSNSQSHFNFIHLCLYLTWNSSHNSYTRQLCCPSERLEVGAEKPFNFSSNFIAYYVFRWYDLKIYLWIA